MHTNNYNLRVHHRHNAGCETTAVKLASSSYSSVRLCLLVLSAWRSEESNKTEETKTVVGREVPTHLYDPSVPRDDCPEAKQMACVSGEAPPRGER